MTRVRSKVRQRGHVSRVTWLPAAAWSAYQQAAQYSAQWANSGLDTGHFKHLE